MAGAATEELPPCGRCTVIGRNRLEFTRLIQPDGQEIVIIRRCPECHPYAGRSCGEHVTPPGHACGLCLHSVGPRADRIYGGPPPAPPGPHEPGDVLRMPVIDIAREQKDLREAGPLPSRIGGRTEREKVMLRELAARQCAASRRAGIRGMFREPEHTGPAGDGGAK